DLLLPVLDLSVQDRVRCDEPHEGQESRHDDLEERRHRDELEQDERQDESPDSADYLEREDPLRVPARWAPREQQLLVDTVPSVDRRDPSRDLTRPGYDRNDHPAAEV